MAAADWRAIGFLWKGCVSPAAFCASSITQAIHWTLMETDSANVPPKPSRTGGDDAVAFTSGAQGAPFSAGVVHAWLAADRRQPLVATGISMGTIATAAMRRVYEELEQRDNDDLEVKRWRWYQRYYQAVTENPVGPLWNALPDPVDFFAETPPAKDLSVPASLHEESENARRHFYLLVKFGVWLANLPVRVSTVATLIVMYVRRTEGYGVWLTTWVSFYWNLCIGLLGLVFHLFRRPQWILESAFQAKPRRRGVRPLFGWTIYILATVLVLLLGCLVAFAMWLSYCYLNRYDLSSWLHWVAVLAVVAALLSGLSVFALKLFASFFTPKSAEKSNKRSWLGGGFLRSSQVISILPRVCFTLMRSSEQFTTFLLRTRPNSFSTDQRGSRKGTVCLRGVGGD